MELARASVWRYTGFAMFARLFERHRLHLREARYVRVAILLAVGINLLDWILTLWFVLPRLTTSPFFALHYNIYFGVDQIGPPWMLLSLPLMGLLILVINSYFSVLNYGKDRLASTFVMILAVLLESLLFLVSFLTLLLNI
jgi:hypothetical protein